MTGPESPKSFVDKIRKGRASMLDYYFIKASEDA